MTLLDLDLIEDNNTVGWMTSDAIGFGGFSTEAEAAYAAWTVHVAEVRRNAQHNSGAPGVPVNEPLTLQTENNGHRFVSTSTQRLARILAPGEDSRSGDSWGFELSVDGDDEVSIRARAHLAYLALRDREETGSSQRS
jgi:hypothetical protein